MEKNLLMQGKNRKLVFVLPVFSIKDLLNIYIIYIVYILYNI